MMAAMANSLGKVLILVDTRRVRGRGRRSSDEKYVDLRREIGRNGPLKNIKGNPGSHIHKHTHTHNLWAEYLQSILFREPKKG